MEIGNKVKKILIWVVVAVIAVIPTVIAVTSYRSVEKAPVSDRSVSQLKLVLPDGNEKVYDRKTLCEEPSIGEDAVAYFLKVNANAEEVKELPDLDPEKTAVYRAYYTGYRKEYPYVYYFTSDSAYAFYQDYEGKVFRIAEKDALAFLQSSFAECLYASSVPPVMRIGDQTVVPAEMRWFYKSYNDVYRETEIDVTDVVSSFVMRGTPGLKFDIAPDYLNVVIKKGGVTVYDGQLDKLDLSSFTENADYTVDIKAKWYEDATRSGYGEATYRISETILAPAEFEVKDRDIRPGEFVVLSAKNIVDPADIVFTCEPAITASPVFLKDGDWYRALLPFGLEEGGKTYRITMTFEDVTASCDIVLEDKTFGSTAFDMGSATAALRSAANEKAYLDALHGVLTSTGEPRHFEHDSFSLPADGNIRAGFGRYCTVNATGVKYRNPWVSYINLGTGASVGAAMDGKVVFVGTTEMSGNTVVIDHGLGLRSVYCCMGVPAVAVGAEVKKGDALGPTGTSGFSDMLGYSFGLYVFETPVSPYLAQDGIIF